MINFWNLPDGSKPRAETRGDDVPIRIDSFWLAFLFFI